MPTFADKVLDNKKIYYPPWAQDPEILPLMSLMNAITMKNLEEGAPVVKIDNIVDHARREISNSKVSLSDLPCIAPPWPVFWTEGKIGLDVMTPDREVLRQQESRFGILVSDVTKVDNPINRLGLVKSKAPENYKWSVDAQVYLEIGPDVFGPFAVWKFWLDENGKCISELFMTTDVRGLMPDDLQIQVEASIYVTILSSMWAIAFMHCKNSVVETVAPNPKLSKKHHKKHGRPYLKHKVIKIDTVENAVARMKSGTGSNDVDTSEIAWHIVPGKMRDYREKGLFGKWHGLFWFNSYAKGSKRRGVNKNDYEVEAEETLQS